MVERDKDCLKSPLPKCSGAREVFVLKTETSIVKLHILQLHCRREVHRRRELHRRSRGVIPVIHTESSDVVPDNGLPESPADSV